MATTASAGSPGKSLSSLLARSDVADIQVSGLCSDSRRVQPGDLFLACTGEQHDARAYIDDAAAAGAVAVVAERGKPASGLPDSVPLVEVTGLPAQLGIIASRFFDQPSASMQVVGVTGTNGKTTVSQLVAQLLRDIGHSCGVIGTLGTSLDSVLQSASHTTPDAISLQTTLSAWRDSNVAYAAMEVSSHALVQGRVNGVCFATAVFTNLSRDHLDYHGSMENYGRAKQRLFGMPGLSTAVVNLDDPFAINVLEGLEPRVARVTVSQRAEAAADLWVSDVVFGPEGVTATLHSSRGETRFSSPLVGEFNVSNILLAVAAVLSLGVEFEAVLACLGGLRPVPGRMETVPNERGLQVVIDYAHTPDALEKALHALRAHTANRLHVVFGCGGDRDRGKRSLMGRIASDLADIVCLTSDNPRSENPDRILQDIAAGCRGEFSLQVDRARAIRLTISNAQQGDCVLIAGKGHEDYQIIGDQRLPFSDFDEASQALEVAA